MTSYSHEFHQVCLHDHSSLLRAEFSQPNLGSASKAHMHQEPLPGPQPG